MVQNRFLVLLLHSANGTRLESHEALRTSLLFTFKRGESLFEIQEFLFFYHGHQPFFCVPISVHLPTWLSRGRTNFSNPSRALPSGAKSVAALHQMSASSNFRMRFSMAAF